MSTSRKPQDYLVYDADSPSGLRWRTHWDRRMLAKLPGKPFGAISSGGYWRGELGGRRYAVHRLVFLICHGYMPNMIDHIDGDRANNRIENLRPTTHKLNGSNRHHDRGFYWLSDRQRWRVAIRRDGKRTLVGDYLCSLDARAAYLRVRGGNV